MGIYDRDYNRPSGEERRISFVLPGLTPVVKVLLIVNIAIFMLQMSGLNNVFTQLFSVYPVTLANNLQIWRLVTYQFLHAGLFHLLFNMLVLYFLGPILEKNWGSVRFLVFYLGCGIAGGLFYTILCLLKVVSIGSLVGASGAILGGMAAAAVLFPNMTVMLFFIIPLKIRTAALIAMVIFIVSVLTNSNNAGGNAAHLGGMLAGGIYTLFFTGKLKVNKPVVSTWHDRFHSDIELQAEVDRILHKVNINGINSLSRKERKILQEATKREQQKNL